MAPGIRECNWWRNMTLSNTHFEDIIHVGEKITEVLVVCNQTFWTCSGKNVLIQLVLRNFTEKQYETQRIAIICIMLWLMTKKDTVFFLLIMFRFSQISLKMVQWYEKNLDTSNAQLGYNFASYRKLKVEAMNKHRYS